MKKLLYLSGIWVPLVLLFSVSCEPQPAATEADLADIKSEMQDVVELIDESINEESVHVFIYKADMALNEIDYRIDQYLSKMDMANERIEQEARNSIIGIKQKVAGIDIRLALLDDENLIGENPLAEFPEETHAIDRVRPPVYPYPYPNITAPPTTGQPEGIDDTAIAEIEEYAIEIHTEIINELKELKAEINEFIAESL